MDRAAITPRTRDPLADDPRPPKAAFATLQDVFERYGFTPLEAPAFERVEILVGKYGPTAPGMLSKVLHRGARKATDVPEPTLRHHTLLMA